MTMKTFLEEIRVNMGRFVDYIETTEPIHQYGWSDI